MRALQSINSFQNPDYRASTALKSIFIMKGDARTILALWR